MEKAVLNLEKHEPKQITVNLLGSDLVVVNDISYDEKVRCAIETAVKCCIIADNTCYKTTLTDAVFTWQLMKWYSNADVSNFSDAEIKDLFDAVFMLPEFETMCQYTKKSFSVVQSIFEKAVEYIERTNISKGDFLSELLIGGKFDEMMQDTSALKEWLLDVIEKADSDTLLPMDRGLGNISTILNNSMVSFAKKASK